MLNVDKTTYTIANPRPRTIVGDGLDLPNFLYVVGMTPEEAAARKRANEEHARLHPPAADVARNLQAERRAAAAAEAKRIKTEQLNALNARTKAKRAAERDGKFEKYVPGTTWDPATGKWVANDAPMPRRRYERLMREMPDEAHRKALEKMYGGGQPCDRTASPSAPSASARQPTGARSARSTAPQTPPKPLRATSAPKSAKATAPATTTAPAKAGRSDASKTARAGGSSKVGLSGMRPEVESKLVAFMAKPRTMDEIGKEMGWLKHSASARVSGLKKVGGYTVLKKDGRYSVTVTA